MRGKKGMGDDATALFPRPKDLIGEVTLPVDFLVLFSRIYPLIDGLQRKRMNLLDGINKRNDQTLIHEDIKDLMQLEKVDGIYYAKCKVVGLDPGKKSAATWVYQVFVPLFLHCFFPFISFPILMFSLFQRIMVRQWQHWRR